MPSVPSGAIALQVTEATKRFGGLVAVDNMTFTLQENEVLGLIGPNGSGKTTMMNLTPGALKPTGGRIELYGDLISGSSANAIALKGVSRTFQIVRMLPSLESAGPIAPWSPSGATG